MKIINFLKYNFAIILLALFSVFIAIYPQLVLQYKLGADYKGIARISSDDENYYWARGQEIIDGHSSLGNPYIFEYKNRPTIQFFMPDFIIAKSLSWTGLSIVKIFFVYDIVLTFLLTVLTYLCLFRLTKSRFWSTSGSTFLIMGMFFYFFNRPISPQFNFIFFLTQFIFLLGYVQGSERSKTYFYLSLLNFGFLFYLYTYYWTFYFILLFILSVFLFIRGNKSLSYGVFSILSGGVLIGSYYIYKSLTTAKIPEYWETLTRLGMIKSHMPSGMAMVLIGGILSLGYLYFFYKTKKTDAVNILLFSGILAGMIAVNQHLITGLNLAFTVHYFLPVLFWYIFSMFFVFSQIENLSLKKSLILIFASYFVIFYISWTNYQITMHLPKYLIDFYEIKDSEIYSQNYAPIFDWLNNNTQKDDVVLSNEVISNNIPVYTHNNILYSRMSNLHFMSDDEVTRRFYINNYFEEKDREFIIKNFPALYGTRYTDIYGHDSQVNKLRSIFGLNLVPLNFYPDVAINKVLSVFESMKKYTYFDLLKQYRVDYFVWDKNKNPDWNLDKYKFLKKEYSINNIEIYKYIKI